MSTAIFPYQHLHGIPNPQLLMPLLPLRLERNATSIDVVGLVDSGAVYSVLPYDFGATFGVNWDSIQAEVLVGGVAGGLRAKLLALTGTITGLPSTTLLFAWVPSNDLPVLLGQVNFFYEFDICFYRTKQEFHVSTRTP